MFSGLKNFDVTGLANAKCQTLAVHVAGDQRDVFITLATPWTEAAVQAKELWVWSEEMLLDGDWASARSSSL